MAKAVAKDLFMQFAELVGTTGADSSALEEVNKNTGLSVRGALIWIVHMVETLYAGRLTANFGSVNYALSTRDGLATMPGIGDEGVIMRGRRRLSVETTGGSATLDPHVIHYSPPIPLAGPVLAWYVQGQANHADGQNSECAVRIGFTTAPLDAAMYTEIAEVWGW